MTEYELPFVLEGEHLPSDEELARIIRARRTRQALPVAFPSLDTLSVARRAFIALIRWYQRRISIRLARRCLMEPSCSRYAEFAVAHEGVISGSISTWKRLRRCRPENEGCVDYPKGVLHAVPSHQHRSSL